MPRKTVNKDSHSTRVIFGADQIAALRKHCKRNKVTVSGFIRDTVLREIGRDDLIGQIKPGRPVESEENE